MPFPKIIPALADLTQDIAGPLPLELLQNWASGTQDLSTAEKLLLGFRIEGTVVSTDTSGLSRLTGETELLEVLARISLPMEIVFSLGTEIGGRAIGTWVADNTEMYYPLSIAPDTVLDAMNEVQYRIRSSDAIRIGICAHSGTYYEIGGGVYGNDARIVESAAERYAGPGEILVTAALISRISNRSAYALQSRPDLRHLCPGGIFRLKAGGRLSGLSGEHDGYPHPFTTEFFEMFRGIRRAADAHAIKRQIYSRYGREKAVLFVSRELSRESADNLASLLDDLLANVLVDAIVRRTRGATGHISNSVGGLAILTFGTSDEALEVGRALLARFEENGLPVRVGIDYGSLLMFDDSGGGAGIMGDPVNIASKLSEDIGERGKIRLTTRAAKRLSKAPAGDAFETEISGVRVRGIVV
jgi:class 3 adenylate cyclase